MAPEYRARGKRRKPLCAAFTANGERCRLEASRDTLCHIHDAALNGRRMPHEARGKANAHGVGLNHKEYAAVLQIWPEAQRIAEMTPDELLAFSAKVMTLKLAIEPSTDGARVLLQILREMRGFEPPAVEEPVAVPDLEPEPEAVSAPAFMDAWSA